MIATRRLSFRSGRATEFIDLTAQLQQLVEETGIREGRVTVQSLHTTLGLAMNENEKLLLADLEALLKRLAPSESTYLHDDFSVREQVAEDEPANGHAHCRNLLLQPSLSVLVEDGCLLLGRWQSVFAVELDGPRERQVGVQLEGAGEHRVDDRRRLVELELERQLHVDPAGVGAPMARLVEAGGKRFRPLLVLQTSRLGPGYDPLRAATLAAAVELIHAATLVHDDYVDESPLRRGRPTVAAAEGPTVAIAVGDYYFAKATRLIAELGNPDVTATVAAAMEAICRSQIDDLEFRGLYPGDEAAYLRVVRGKTAALIAAACVAGAQLSGADPEVIERLRRFGEAIGIAFQMADDVVDFSTASGKPLGQDIRERVLSLPLIYATEHPELGAELRDLLAGALDDGDLDKVVDLVARSGALERVNRQATELVAGAVTELSAVDLDGVKAGLVDLAHAVVGREA
jgi:secondary thiamine-phosphate synthase enzyme